MSKYVVTYFALSADDTVAAYREWSLEYVRPVMRAMPSVVSFVDGVVVGSMDGHEDSWSGCELIEVTDFGCFERDNAAGEGGVLARLWRERLDSWSIGYVQDFADAETDESSEL